MQTSPVVPLRIGIHTGDVILEENNIYYDSRLHKRYDELLNNSVERNNAFLLQHQSKFKKFSEFFVQEHQRLQFELQNN